MEAYPFDLPCRLCDAGAVAIYYFDLGCVCFPDEKLMALCEQHIYKATPIGNMKFICRPPGVISKDEIDY